MGQPITINLPDSVYEQLQRAAELSQQPLEVIIAQSLTQSLPPLLDDIPPEYQPDVYPLLQMDIVELQQEVKRIFPEDQWTKYEALLAEKKVKTLTSQKQRQLDALRREADVLTFRKAYAAVLLKRRGYQVTLPGR